MRIAKVLVTWVALKAELSLIDKPLVCESKSKRAILIACALFSLHLNIRYILRSIKKAFIKEKTSDQLKARMNTFHE